MKLHAKHHTYVMENLSGLDPDIETARKAVLLSKISYARLARQIGVTKDMVGKVLTGRRTSKRVLDGIMEICKQRRMG